MPMPPHPVLAEGAVRHVGDPVAFIVADTIASRRATPPRRSRSSTTSCPSITDLGRAIDRGRAAGLAGSSARTSAFDWEIGDKAATDKLFAEAAHVTRLTVVNNRIVVNSHGGARRARRFRRRQRALDAARQHPGRLAA